MSSTENGVEEIEPRQEEKRGVISFYSGAYLQTHIYAYILVRTNQPDWSVLVQMHAQRIRTAEAR